MIKNDREYRDLRLAASEKEKRVTGYASTFNEPYLLWGSEDYKFFEVVDREAFNDTDMSDIIFQYNHEGRVFARTSNNTLIVRPDDKGLYIEADLSGTEIGRDLYEEIRGGYTTKMSFGFTVLEDAWEEHDEEKCRVCTRTIKKVGKVYDVSAVSIPANDATSISVRNLTDGVIERVQAERLEEQKLVEARKKLLTRIRLSEVLSNDH